MPDDRALDAVWVALERGDVVGAEEAAERVENLTFRQRARLDAVGAARGRVGALATARALDGEAWHAARYDASAERARERLSERVRRADDEPGVWLEWGRRSLDVDGRRVGAWRAEDLQPGLIEAWLLTVDAHLLEGELEEADAELSRLEEVASDLARVRWARRRWQWAVGQRHALTLGVIDDIALGLATPSSLATLGEILATSPHHDLVEPAIDALLVAAGEAGDLWRAESARQLALGYAAQGRWEVAVEWLARLATLDPVDARRLDMWRAAARGVAPTSNTAEIAARRLASAWRAYATASYRDAVERGISRDLDAFIEYLDLAAEQIPDAPRLAWLPRTSFGVVGEMIDTTPLRTALPNTFLIGGKALGLPSDLTWYDELERLTVPMPAALDAADTYLRHLVREARVPGVLVWSGRAITGAGLHRTVFLDVDAIMRQTARTVPASLTLPVQPWPIGGPLDIDLLDLAEPLDIADRLRAAVRAECASPDDYLALLVDEVAVHEEKHIADASEALTGSLGDTLGLVFNVGLLPSSVRAALEERAQLHALRNAREPRLALASMIDFLPVEGARERSEHAVGYRDVLAAFLAVLDAEAWPGAVALTELGLDRDHVLLHQLDRLDVETLRAIARAIPD